MSEKQFYLKGNIQVEPLINNWYAWIHLLPPSVAAFHIVERHIPILKSFISDPDYHAIAVKDPAMRGGPFINLEVETVDELSDSLAKIEEKSHDLFEFVEAVKQLDKLLIEKANGLSLEPLYKQIPAPLKGHVELYYDRHHRADFRFYESLLYKSRFYKEEFQNIALSVIESDTDRPFIFSTPRIDKEDVLRLSIPFKSTGLDDLFEMKRKPRPLSEIAEILSINEDQIEVFESFFTEEEPKKYESYTGEGVRLRYFGHACMLLETQNRSILVDPVLSYTFETDVPRYTYEDLPDKIDFVLITHGHHDHILIETMLQIRHKVDQIIVGKNIDGALQDPSLKLLLRELGFKNVYELTELEQLKIGDDITITGVPFIGEHHDLHVGSKIAYHLKFPTISILSVADACNISPELYEKIEPIVGQTDILLLGMECDGAPISWVYGPLITKALTRDEDHSRRGRGSNFVEGINMVNRFGCKQVYVYAMGAEPWVQYILDVHYTEESRPIVQSNMLIDTCTQLGIQAERLYLEKELLLD